MNLSSQKKLQRRFYSRDVVEVAKALLGKIIVKNDCKPVLAGRIVEVEAYHGDFDQAAHSYRGKTRRTEVMFRKGGYLYVYFTYGAHYCCNVVTGREGQGTAVLIRAVEPLSGIQKMTKNRFGRNIKNISEIFNLTSGPGKFCRAFGIDKSYSGVDLLDDKIFILQGKKIQRKNIGVSARIGITKSTDLPWRFYIKNNPYLSRK